MKLLFPCALSSIVFLAGCGDARQDSDGNSFQSAGDQLQTDPAAPPSAETATSLTPGALEFLTKATSSSRLVVMLSELELERGTDAAAKSYAEDMIAAHSEMSSQLSDTLMDARLPRPTGAPLTESHQNLIADLERTTTDNFDQEFLRLQLFAHQEALAIFSEYATDGDHAALRNFASRMIPEIEAHIDMAPSTTLTE